MYFKLVNTDFGKCYNRCLPLSLPHKASNDIASCETNEDKKCAIDEIIFPMFNHINEKELCPKSCSILQYSGKVLDEQKLDPKSSDKAVMNIWYKFKLPESVPVYEEYLIYDAIGMIGAVGGTLGMFIGFSFNNLIYYVINLLPKISIIIQKNHARDKTLTLLER